MYNFNPALMRRLREILRNEYIGAIAIGFLLFQAFGGVINTVMQPLITYIQLRNRPRSVMGGGPSIFNWPQISVGLTDVALHLIVAFLLIFWLYRAGKAKPQPLAEAAEAGSSRQPQIKS